MTTTTGRTLPVRAARAARVMASKHREQKAIAAVACPDCGAPRGEKCRRKPGERLTGRLFICRGRLVAWQMVRDGEVH